MPLHTLKHRARILPTLVPMRIRLRANYNMRWKSQRLHLTARKFHSTSALPSGVHKTGHGTVRDMRGKGNENYFKLLKQPNTVSIIGAPLTYGQPFVGSDSSPALMRESGLREMLTKLGWRVEDKGDLDFEGIASRCTNQDIIPNARNCEIVGSSCDHLASIVEQTAREGRFPLILGGDHSLGMGTLTGILRVRPNTGVLWIDAHADINTPDTSGSGNMHGMPIGLLMDGVYDKHAELPAFDWLESGPRLQPESIVYVGLRDVDLPEQSIIRTLGIQAFTMHDIDHLGIGTVMDLALQHLLEKNPTRPLHLSYDIDAVDPHYAPATGTAVRGGLTYREAHFVAEFVARSGNLASAEIVELNQMLADGPGAKETVLLGLQLVTSMLGKSIIG